MNDPQDRDPVDAQVVDELGLPVEEFEETVDGVPVLETPPAAAFPVPLPATALAAVSSPAMQAAAAAATGFVAGAATLAIVRRRESRRRTRTALRRRTADALPIAGTRSFLIDVHMLRSE